MSILAPLGSLDTIFSAKVVDGILIWRDKHHLTATFSRHLAPTLEKVVAPLVH